jgi:uncharacterized protein (DUF433 family)
LYFREYYLAIFIKKRNFAKTYFMVLSFQEVENYVGKLPMSKQAELLNFLSKNLGETYPGIEKTPNVCGGSACVIRTRIPIWTLVTLKKAKVTDINLLKAYPTLRQQDLLNAWSYYKANKKEIDQDIKENNDD